MLALEFTQGHIDYLKRKIYDGNIESFQVDTDLEVQALKSSTSAFKDLIKSFTQRLTLLLENLPDPEISMGLRAPLQFHYQNFYTSCLNQFQMTYSSTSDDFFEFVFNNTYHTIATTVSEICGGIIKRDPKSFKKNARILIEKLRTKSMKTKQEGTKVVLISFHVIKHFSGI